MSMWRSFGGRAAVIALVFIVVPSESYGQARRVEQAYSDEKACASAAKVPAEQCANAAANARAEFDEKAPRFPTREACERVFASARCSVGFSGSDGWAGKKSAVYFSPRMLGFRLITGDRDPSVIPYTSGPGIAFGRRTILRRDTGVNFNAARQARHNWSAHPAGLHGGQGGGQTYGVDTPPPGLGPGALPPRPANDPNFDCAAVLEPGARDSADTGCYPVPARRR